MDVEVRTDQHGTPTGLFRSLTQLLSTIVTLAQTRLELLATEVQEEIHRAAELLLWSAIALISVGFALLFIGLTIIYAFWETNRVLASVLVTSAFIVIPVVCFLVIRSKIKSRPRILDATRAELLKDREHLEAKL
jgi:uncharacterized membrane protein YqjE